jgi:membrane-associated phospholipid phosphatase
MAVQPNIAETPTYFSQLVALIGLSARQLVRSPSSPRRAEAAQRLLRQASLLTVIVGAAIIALMYAVDAWEISLMPPRGTASLWPVRIFTDLGKTALVLWILAAMLFAVAIVSPRLQGTRRSLLLKFGTHLEFLFFSVLVPVLAGEVIKWIVGRGRPFVGGEANAFNFVHFAGTEAYASFPSAHAITSFALAFAVSVVWPRARIPMILYAVLIAVSRLVLLAHHPSDVVAGALVGVVGAMAVQYWFAARRLGFAIAQDGAFRPFIGPSLGVRKRVAHEASGP